MRLIRFKQKFISGNLMIDLGFDSGDVVGQYCEVCMETKPRLYHLANCNHLFCQDCCIGYIEARASSFTQTRCLSQGCNAHLDQNQEIYELLSDKVKQTIGKFKDYKNLHTDKHRRACRRADCSGQFTVKHKQANYRCNQCGTEHCKKCLQVQHQGKCLENQDQAMAKLKLQKCPTCGAWVEKIVGCEYISCKCGTDFCYKCGAEFDRDPCRMAKQWDGEYNLRNVLHRVSVPTPKHISNVPKFLCRLLVLLLVLPLSVLMWVPLAALLFAIGLIMSAMCGPFVVCQMVGAQMRRKNQEFSGCCGLCMFLFFPLWSVMVVIIFMVLVCMYPCTRRSYHHGIYDAWDGIIMGVSTCFLSMIACCIGQP